MSEDFVMRDGVKVPVMIEPGRAVPHKFAPKRKPFKSKLIVVPVHWRDALRGATGATYALALAVLDEKHKRNHLGGDIVLSAQVTGMKKDARRAATKELVRLNLIEVGDVGCGGGVGDGHHATRVTKIK